jgi:SRSO17 transposase
MVTQGGGIASGVGGGWAAGLAALHARIAGRFARVEVQERVRRYLVGLLGRVERKKGWQLAEALGEAGPQGVQRLLNAATWDAEGVRDDLRAYVVEHLGDAASGVLIVDETGFVKKGKKSCGVGTQYTGAVGGTANAQVGVFLAYASAKGTALVDRALPLPRAWTHDPDDVAFYVAYGPAGTPEAELVRVCGMRWRVEEGFARAEGEVGLDQYEVRTWVAWHRFVTLAVLARAYLAVTPLAASQDEAAEKRGAPIPA